MVDRTIRLRDGRTMAYAEWGEAKGPPVLVCHGIPGSRHLGRTFTVPARLIVPDRPGYGLSDPRPGRSVQDWVQDARALLDHLELQTFHVFGISGGAPYVCAVAAAFGIRVRRGAIFSGIGPLYLPHALQGMDPVQAAILRVARRAPRALGPLAAQQASHMQQDPEATVRQIVAALPAYDQALLQESRAVYEGLVETQREGSRRLEGPIEDAIAFVRPWGVDFTSIRSPIRLWHGDRDETAPLRLARILAESIPGAQLTVVPGAGHIGTLRHLPEAVRYLLEEELHQPE